MSDKPDLSDVDKADASKLSIKEKKTVQQRKLQEEKASRHHQMMMNLSQEQAWGSWGGGVLGSRLVFRNCICGDFRHVVVASHLYYQAKGQQ